MRPLKRTFRAAASPVRAHPRISLGITIGLLLVIAALSTFAWLRSTPSSANRQSRSEGDTTPTLTQPEGPVEPAPRPTHAVSFDEGCLNAACHANLTTAHTIHAPVADDACQTCHQPDAGNHTYPLLAKLPENLCSSCHDLGDDKPVIHGALAQGQCLACHTPHTSEGPHLLVAPSTRDTCKQCHLIAEGLSRHAPYDTGDCTVCHDPHSSDNPSLLLAGEGAEHCSLCHAPIADDVANARHAHRELERDCLSCHAHHASENPGLLLEPTKELCLDCHQDVRKTISAAVVTHDPVLTGEHCLSCHAPHASDNPAMLLDDQAGVCLSCHDKKLTTSDGRNVRNMADVIRDSPFVHGPVKSSQCSACHAVHGAQYQRLLASINPAVLTGTFDIHNYALCFSCHDQNLVLEPRTTVATQFRNGDLNLHYVHVRDKGSRNCADCHAVHGAAGPHLIADSVPFQGSDWLMPINYVSTPTGGSCASGCHEQLSYDRNAPITNPSHPGGEP